MEYTDFRGQRISRLGLGTVQFGLDYGFTKQKSQAQVDDILIAAAKVGINLIDTAVEYGNSEEKIGSYLSRHRHSFIIATKIKRVPENILASAEKTKNYIRQSIQGSLDRLGVKQLFLLQTHQASDAELLNDNFWKALKKLKQEGLFQYLGISVYDVVPTNNAVYRHGDAIDFVQLPYNLVNESFWSLKNLFQKKKIGVISRSTFLQGVLTSGGNDLTGDPAETRRIKRRLTADASKFKLNLEQYALLHAISQEWFSSTIIGVDAPSEIHANASLFSKLPSFRQIQKKIRPVIVTNKDWIDPRQWRGSGVMAFLQARMSSSRLPGKVMKPILGEPMLWRQIERIRRSTKIKKLVVVTSVDASDNAIEDFCKTRGIDCFRGSLENVLDRFYQAALKFKPAHIIRLTGDCPLSDPQVIDRLITFYEKGDYDYASNKIPPTFPDGLDVEIFKSRALYRAWKEARVTYEKEHVTPFFYGNPKLFKLGSFCTKKDTSVLRWTVDTAEDFKKVKKIYEALYPKKKNFDSIDVLNWSGSPVRSFF